MKCDKFILLEILLLLTCFNLNAQNSIDTDSPDKSDGTHIVEMHSLQVESNIQFSRTDNFTKEFDNVTLIRYGIAKRFELRLVSQYSAIRDSNFISGIQPLTISFKNQLCNEQGLLPKLTLVSYFQLPLTVSNAYKGDHFGYTFTLAGSHDLSKNLSLCSNFGVTQDQQSADLSYHGTMEINYIITAKLGSYIEYFGNYAIHNSTSNGMDLGLIYTLKNNFAVNLALGSSTIELNTNRFISLGLALRLPK